MSKRNKRDDVLKVPGRIGGTPADRRRKLSEIIKEMARRVLRRPDDPPSFLAAETAVLLAGAAWNAALGDSSLREQQQGLLDRLGFAGDPWGELSSQDTDRLVAGLIEYKWARYAADRRRILACGTNPDFTVTVQWMDEEDFIAAVLEGSTQPHASADERPAANDDERLRR